MLTELTLIIPNGREGHRLNRFSAELATARTMISNILTGTASQALPDLDALQIVYFPYDFTTILGGPSDRRYDRRSWAGLHNIAGVLFEGRGAGLVGARAQGRRRRNKEEDDLEAH